MAIFDLPLRSAVASRPGPIPVCTFSCRRACSLAANMAASQACVPGQLEHAAIAAIGLAGLSLVTWECCWSACTCLQIHPINSDRRLVRTSMASPRCNLRAELFRTFRWNHSNPTTGPFHWPLTSIIAILWTTNASKFNVNRPVQYRCYANLFAAVVLSYSTPWLWSQGSQRSSYCCCVGTCTWLPWKTTVDCATTVFNWAWTHAILLGNLFQVKRSHH